MKYSQSKELVDELMNIAVLFHASSMLRTKIADVIDKHIPDLDPACMERGCTAVDDFKEKNT
jgi:DNA-directed RNA polymerase subunit F